MRSGNHARTASSSEFGMRNRPISSCHQRHRSPAGILTFLFADIRGWTAFTQQNGDEAAARLAAKFAEVTREGVESRGGRVIELRGDEALAVFTSARAAVRAAVDLQAVYADETTIEAQLPLTGSIGMDVGEAVPVEGGYRGAALNLGARLNKRASVGEVTTYVAGLTAMPRRTFFIGLAPGVAAYQFVFLSLGFWLGPTALTTIQRHGPKPGVLLLLLVLAVGLGVAGHVLLNRARGRARREVGPVMAAAAGGDA
jgi:hypothetical protein